MRAKQNPLKRLRRRFVGELFVFVFLRAVIVFFCAHNGCGRESRGGGSGRPFKKTPPPPFFRSGPCLLLFYLFFLPTSSLARVRTRVRGRSHVALLASRAARRPFAPSRCFGAAARRRRHGAGTQVSRARALFEEAAARDPTNRRLWAAFEGFEGRQGTFTDVQVTRGAASLLPAHASYSAPPPSPPSLPSLSFSSPAGEPAVLRGHDPAPVPPPRRGLGGRRPRAQRPRQGQSGRESGGRRVDRGDRRGGPWGRGGGSWAAVRGAGFV